MAQNLQCSWVLFVLLMSVSATQATLFATFYEMVEPELNIPGSVKPALTVETGRHCSAMCLKDNNCYAYQYRQIGLENCVLIYTMCLGADGNIFERDDNNVIYKKGWGLQPIWKGPKAVLYLSLDGSDGLVFMEGTQEIYPTPLVSGHVNCAWMFNDTRSQWVDLGIHTEVCIARPDTCGAAGGEYSLWINVLSCSYYDGIITSRVDESSGFRIYCLNGNTYFEILRQDVNFGAGSPKPSGWTHIVLNYLGPNNGQGIRIYYNETEVASDTTKTSHGFSAGDGRIVVGRYRTNRNDHYGNAQVDELIFFNQALSKDDITMLHNGLKL